MMEEEADLRYGMVASEEKRMQEVRCSICGEMRERSL